MDFPRLVHGLPKKMNDPTINEKVVKGVFPTPVENTNCDGERRYSVKKASSREFVVANLLKKNHDFDMQQRYPSNLTPWNFHTSKDNLHNADLTVNINLLQGS